MENKFRCLCELCTALTFTAFLINLICNSKNTNVYVVMCSALIAIFTLLANRQSDKASVKKGIGSQRDSLLSKIYICILQIRLILETILAGISIFLILAYFITSSNQGEIFNCLAYYESTICIGAFATVEWFLFIISLVLIGIEKLNMSKNTMNNLMQ